MYRPPSPQEKSEKVFLRGGGVVGICTQAKNFRIPESGIWNLEYFTWRDTQKFWLIEYFAYFLSVFSPNEDDSGYYVEEDPEFDDEINEEFEKFLQEQGALFNWNCESITVDIPSVNWQ